MDTPETSPAADTGVSTSFAAVRGWTPERKARFLDCLAEKGNVRLACARVGLSAEAAYRLRRRDELFARAWAAAQVLALEASGQLLADRAIDGIEEDIWYRGELVGTRTRYDTRLFLAHIARLDRQVEQGTGAADAGRFDELLALIVGEEPPEYIAAPDDALPLDRHASSERAAGRAESNVCADRPHRPDGGYDDDNDHDGKDLRELEGACEEAAYYAGEECGAEWDRWRAHAFAIADRACGWSDAPIPAAPAPARVSRSGTCPSTVSTVSTSALARALAHPAAMPAGRSKSP